MATITSNRNDNSSTHVTVNPALTTTWAGGVVPQAVDQVFIAGRRTTINQSSFAKWTGTRTITVASTTNFASSGFFYTQTDRGHILKVNYTGTTATTFTGCSLDESEDFYAWDDSLAVIFNGAYVHNPAYIVKIETGNVFECNELIIQEGGWLWVEGNLKINQGILVRDGRLIGRGNGNIIISRPAGTTTSSTTGYLTGENYYISIIDIDGGEVRSFANLTVSANVNDCSITVSSVNNGSFAVGDEIAIYGYNDYRLRNRGYVGYRDATVSFKNLDEGVDVCGVSGNTLYIAKRYGATGNILSVVTEGNNQVLEVNPDSLYFNAGDKVVINSNVYTITDIQDSEVTLYNYDFTNPDTSLSDFWVDDPFHVYSSTWSIDPGVGLRITTGSYRELVHKYFWSRESIIEAEMSPLTSYTTGSRGTAAFGIMSAYDPGHRFGHRGYDSFKTDYFAIDDANADVLFYIRSMSNDNNNVPSRDTNLLNTIRGPATYKIVNRKAKSTVYINGEEFTTEFRRDGHFKGLVGIYTNANTSFRCKRLTIKVPTQRITLNTSNVINAGDIVYQSGLDNTHPVGRRVVKISSKNTGEGNHTNLAFGYLGQNGTGVFPHVIQQNGANTASSNFVYLLNNDANIDYYHNLGETTSNVSVTIDLTYPQDFSHVSFHPRTADTSGYYGYKNVCVLASNNLTNWDILYGPTDDTKRWYSATYGRLAFYPTGNVNYRFVKFQTAGDQGGSNRNRYVGLGVHNFRDGYLLSLNNASDFNVGDTITVMGDSGYVWANRELEAYQAWVGAGTNPEEYYHSGWLTECTITAKDNNLITLDRPVWWNYIEGKDSVTVVKTNRNFVITGTMGPTNAFSEWRWPNISTNSGSNTTRKYLFRNVRMSYIGSARHSGSTNFNRGVFTNSQDYWNHPVFDGVVHQMGPDGTSWQGVGNGSAGFAIYRNSLSMGQYWAYYQYYHPSHAGSAVFNCKMTNTLAGIYNEGSENFYYKYNEINNVERGIVVVALRTDRLTGPQFSEIKHTLIKGSTQYGVQSGPSNTIRRTSFYDIDYIKLRGMDDYSVYGYVGNYIPFNNANFMADHTGARMSRYRNESHFIPTGGTDYNAELVYTPYLKNFGRFGYDLITIESSVIEISPERPGEVRFYRFSSDSYLPLMGIQIESYEDVAFQIYVKFDYKISWMDQIKDDHNQDGRVLVMGLQNGEIISQSPQYGVVPQNANKSWQTFEYTFNTFNSVKGRAAVYMARAARNGYLNVRNSTAVLLTDNPSKIRVVVNSFKINNILDQLRENTDTKPLTTANARTLNIRKFKF